MALTDDLRKTLTDPTPLYVAAGTADLAAEKLRTVLPGLLERLRAQAPGRWATLRGTDLATVREQAQSLAFQGVGWAAQCAIRARETYDELADRGRGAVEAWRGGTDPSSTTFPTGDTDQPTTARDIPDAADVAMPPKERTTTARTTSGGTRATRASRSPRAGATDTTNGTARSGRTSQTGRRSSAGTRSGSSASTRSGTSRSRSSAASSGTRKGGTTGDTTASRRTTGSTQRKRSTPATEPEQDA